MTEEKARQVMRRAIEAERAEESLGEELEMFEALKEREKNENQDCDRHGEYDNKKHPACRRA